MARIDRYPDSTEDIYYINMGMVGDAAGMSLADLVLAAKVYFGEETDLDSIKISTEHIHTRCIGYDQYDPSDYDLYIILQKE